MYTQCSKCETVFKLSAEALRAAGGQVRCGRCGEVFNALAHLAEEPGAFSSGESSLELETRADSILESVADPRIARASPEPSTEFVAPGVEIAHLEVLEDASMEFSLPPGELDRIFVEAPPRTLPPAPPNGSNIGLEVSEEVRQEILEGIEPDFEPADLVAERTPGRTFVSWLFAAAAAALLLIAQAAHYNREWFAAHGPFGGVLGPIYATFGKAVPPPSNLSAYQLRQWGVTGDPDANGTLRVRASILNAAAQPAPYPLMRVALANRFGAPLGARDFEPSEYLGKAAAQQMAPGEQADANLEILDPGNNAEGFEIDVCLRAADQRVGCANDGAAAARK